MNIPTLYIYDLLTGAYAGSRPAQIVGGKPLVTCSNATLTPPPDAPAGHVARWTGSTWEVVEDHRQHMDATGTRQGGTPCWMPDKGDDYTSPPRYMDTLGPLPDGAVTECPEKPLSVIKNEMAHEIREACDAAIVASLTMPSETPSSLEVTMAAASLAAIDPDGPDTLLALHSARRDELLSQVREATTAEDVAAIEVSYAV